MPPELCGNKNPDPDSVDYYKADYYGLGVLFFALLVNSYKRVEQVLASPVANVEEGVPSTSTSYVEEVLRQGLATQSSSTWSWVS